MAEAAAEAELKSTAKPDSTEVQSSLLSVKQDFSRLSAELSENDNSIMSTVSECDKSVDDDDDDAVPEAIDADTDVDSTAVNEPGDVTAAVTDLPQHDVHASLCEDQDDPCDSTSTHFTSPLMNDNSPSSDTEDRLQLTSSSDNHKDVITSCRSSGAILKAPVKRKSAEYKSSTADKRLNSPPCVKKLRQHKIEVSPVQHVKTSSGVFVVHKIAQTGKML